MNRFDYKIHESNAGYRDIGLYSQQRGTKSVLLEQKVVKDFCRLSSKTDLHNWHS